MSYSIETIVVSEFPSQIATISYNPPTNDIVVGSKGGLYIVDSNNLSVKSQIPIEERGESIFSMEIVNGGETVAVSCLDRMLRTFSSSGALISAVKLHSHLVSMSTNATHLIGGAVNGSIIGWTADGNAAGAPLPAHEGAVAGVVLTTEGNIASVSETNGLKVLPLDFSEQQIANLKDNAEGTTIAFLEGSFTNVMSIEGNGLVLWNKQNSELVLIKDVGSIETSTVRQDLGSIVASVLPLDGSTFLVGLAEGRLLIVSESKGQLSSTPLPSLEGSRGAAVSLIPSSSEDGGIMTLTVGFSSGALGKYVLRCESPSEEEETLNAKLAAAQPKPAGSLALAAVTAEFASFRTTTNATPKATPNRGDAAPVSQEQSPPPSKAVSQKASSQKATPLSHTATLPPLKAALATSQQSAGNSLNATQRSQGLSPQKPSAEPPAAGGGGSGQNSPSRMGRTFLSQDGMPVSIPTNRGAAFTGFSGFTPSMQRRPEWDERHSLTFSRDNKLYHPLLRDYFDRPRDFTGGPSSSPMAIAARSGSPARNEARYSPGASVGRTGSPLRPVSTGRVSPSGRASPSTGAERSVSPSRQSYAPMNATTPNRGAMYLDIPTSEERSQLRKVTGGLPSEESLASHLSKLHTRHAAGGVAVDAYGRAKFWNDRFTLTPAKDNEQINPCLREYFGQDSPLKTRFEHWKDGNEQF